MCDMDGEISKALISEQAIAREKKVSCIRTADDLEVLAKLYRLTRDRYYQIQPALGGPITCGLIPRYLRRCIAEDVAEQQVNVSTKLR